jgi:hypothetical protein
MKTHTSRSAQFDQSGFKQDLRSSPGKNGRKIFPPAYGMGFTDVSNVIQRRAPDVSSDTAEIAGKLDFSEASPDLERISANEAFIRLMENLAALELPYPYRQKGQSGAGPRPAKGIRKSNYIACSPALFTAYLDLMETEFSIDLGKDRPKLFTLREAGEREYADWGITGTEANAIANSNPKRSDLVSEDHLQTRGLIDLILHTGQGELVENFDDLREGDILSKKSSGGGGHAMVVYKIVRYEKDEGEHKKGEIKKLWTIDASYGKKEGEEYTETVSHPRKKKEIDVKNYKGKMGETGNPAIRPHKQDVRNYRSIFNGEAKKQRLYAGRLFGTVLWDKQANKPVSWDYSKR